MNCATRSNLYFFEVSLLCAVVFLFLFSCEAPRNNPLDPQNPEHRFATIEGTVQTLSLPHKGIGQVSIHWDAGRRFLKSEANGSFIIEDIKTENGWLFFEKDGFHPDSLFIDWSGSTHQVLEQHLNARPVLDSLVFYSQILNYYPDIQILELSVRAKIGDSDNDIDSVFFINPEIGFSMQLSFNPVDRFFEQPRITTQRLGISTAEDLTGKSFEIVVKDLFQNRITIPNILVKRFVKEDVLLKSPVSHEVVSVSPTLRWQPVNPGYPVTYMLEIRTDEADAQLVWFKEGLSGNTSFYEVDIALPTTPLNSYIWTVWVIDEYGNRARSKYKSFSVE